MFIYEYDIPFSFSLSEPNVKRAKGVGSISLAILMASSRVSYGRIDQTGPNDSSTTMLSFTSSTSTTVGSMKKSLSSMDPPITILPLELSTIFFSRS